MKKFTATFILIIIIISILIFSFLLLNKRENINLGFTKIKLPFTQKSELLKSEFFKSEQVGEVYIINGEITNVESKKISVNDKKNTIDMYIYIDTEFIIREIVNDSEQIRILYLDDSNFNEYIKAGKYISATYEFNRENDIPKATEIIIWDFIK